MRKHLLQVFEVVIMAVRILIYARCAHRLQELWAPGLEAHQVKINFWMGLAFRALIRSHSWCLLFDLGLLLHSLGSPRLFFLFGGMRIWTTCSRLV